MKKIIWRSILIIAILLAILFTPIPKGVYKDGGTREYAALTYKLVDWNRLIDGGNVYDATKIYWFPNSLKSIDELWEQEKQNVVHKFMANVLEVNGRSILVEPVVGELELLSSDRFYITLPEDFDEEVQVGNTMDIFYTGDIMETYPAQVIVYEVRFTKDLRHKAYTGQWLDKETAAKEPENTGEHLVITEVYSDCFFAYPLIPMPYQIKMNATLSEDWCVGDQVVCTFENAWLDENSYGHVEADMLTIKVGTTQLDPNVAYKPVIYLYPEEETQVSVKLSLDGELLCTYPAYNSGWQVTAAPDGTLTDANGQTYSYLYWEGQTNARWDMTKGFCVKGADTAAFLENALEKLGLSRREANEFIVYWLPLMEQNPYNVISFQTACYTNSAQLEVTPAPDTVIRVFMTWYAADGMLRLLPQKLETPERTGFTVVEWGGTEITKPSP